jgi:hypothetical protein
LLTTSKLAISFNFKISLRLQITNFESIKNNTKFHESD